MLNLDPGKLLVIGVVAIILLGPDRLPQVARQLGGAWRSFNEFRHRMESEVRNTMPDLPPTSEIARLARSPSALLNHLSTMSTDEAPDGSFEPPTPPSENGTSAPAGTDADNSTAAPPPEAGTDHQPAPAPEPAHPPAATPAVPGPSASPAPRPPRAPQPSGVVVPGDPTLN
jgi:sec-independent protein translocase protein TatB